MYYEQLGFLSVVVVLEKHHADASDTIHNLSQNLARISAQYELILVDNRAFGGERGDLRELASEEKISNLQVYALTKSVSRDIAVIVGLNKALGDCVLITDPWLDDSSRIVEMLEALQNDRDVVFARNTRRLETSAFRRLGMEIFFRLYHLTCGVRLDYDAPALRILRKPVVNFILQHPLPDVVYRHLPATGGFSKGYLAFPGKSQRHTSEPFLAAVGRATHLLLSTSKLPLRASTLIACISAGLNLAYSVYVLGVALTKEDVAPGWITLSLQHAGMFFLLSLVLAIIGEYVGETARMSDRLPQYHIGKEYHSRKFFQADILNLDEVTDETENMQDHVAREDANRLTGH